MARTATQGFDSHENQEMYEIKIKAQRRNSPVLFVFFFSNVIGMGLGQACSFALLLIQVIYPAC